jgi:hypothetical protein
VHGDACFVFLAEISAIAGMVDIPVGQDDQLQVSRLAACVQQSFFQISAAAADAGIDQDKTVPGFNKIAINETKANGANFRVRVRSFSHIYFN